MTVARNTGDSSTLDERVVAEFANTATEPGDEEGATVEPAEDGGERVGGSETTLQPSATPSTEPVVAEPEHEPSIEQGETPPSSPSSSTSLPDHYDVLGRQITPAEAEAMFNVYEWAKTLTQEQVAGIDRVLAGQSTPEPAPPSTPAPAPTSTASDPYEDPALTAMRAELDQVKAQLAATSAQPTAAGQPAAQSPPFDAQLHQHRTLIAQDVMNTTQEQLGLNQAEAELIAQRIISSGELGALEGQMGDFRSAMERAVQSQVWLDPFFREKAIAAQAPKAEAQTASTAERKAASSALAGSTGSSTRESPAAPITSRQAQIDAMAKEIARDMQAG